MPRNLLVAISSHGFGHLAQVAPVINALQRFDSRVPKPSFDLTIRASLPEHQIAWRILYPFKLDRGSDDFGMVMHDALRVDLAQSLRQYAALHQNWDREVQRLADHLQQLGVTHLLANAPYLTLAAAHAASIPSAAICSLNWADILERCVAASPDALAQAGMSNVMLERVLRQMRDAYATAKLIVRPEPSIETTGFKTVTTEPLAEIAPKADRLGLVKFVRQASGAYLAGHEDFWLVLTSMGGIALPLDPENWPTSCLGKKVIYLMDPAMAGRCPHTVGFDLEQMSFAQMMASCDAVLTKPGYGMFVESRASGKPMLYIARDDWPESECLELWANTHAQASKLSLEQVCSGSFGEQLSDLLGLKRQSPLHFQGAQTAAALIVKHLLSD